MRETNSRAVVNNRNEGAAPSSEHANHATGCGDRDFIGPIYAANGAADRCSLLTHRANDRGFPNGDSLSLKFDLIPHLMSVRRVNRMARLMTTPNVNLMRHIT